MKRRLAVMALVGATLAGAMGAPPASAAFPGSNGHVVFDTSADFGTSSIRQSEIWRTRPSGHATVQLTEFPGAAWASHPRVSPDGRLVVFVVSNDGENDQLWLVDSDGQNQRLLAAHRRHSYAAPAFTASGRRVLYSSRGGYDFGYFTCRIESVRLDGSGVRTIVGGSWHPGQPVASPDGSTVAYISDKGGYDARIWLVDSDGTEVGADARTIGPTFGVEQLSWSPDGSHIAFTGDFRNGGVYTIAADGSDLQKVIPDALFPSWSPDGTRLVYLNPLNGDLERARVDGTHATTLVPDEDVPGVAFSDWGVEP